MIHDHIIDDEGPKTSNVHNDDGKEALFPEQPQPPESPQVDTPNNTHKSSNKPGGTPKKALKKIGILLRNTKSRTAAGSKNTKQILKIQQAKMALTTRKQKFGVEYMNLLMASKKHPNGGEDDDDDHIVLLQECVAKAEADVAELEEQLALCQETIASNRERLVEKIAARKKGVAPPPPSSSGGGTLIPSPSNSTQETEEDHASRDAPPALSPEEVAAPKSKEETTRDTTPVVSPALVSDPPEKEDTDDKEASVTNSVVSPPTATAPPEKPDSGRIVSRAILMSQASFDTDDDDDDDDDSVPPPPPATPPRDMSSTAFAALMSSSNNDKPFDEESTTDTTSQQEDPRRSKTPRRVSFRMDTAKATTSDTEESEDDDDSEESDESDVSEDDSDDESEATADSPTLETAVTALGKALDDACGETTVSNSTQDTASCYTSSTPLPDDSLLNMSVGHNPSAAHLPSIVHS